MPTVRTIADLARIAGVSPATVSRSLADSALIAIETRRKIRVLADAHGFRPNQVARNLRTQKAGAIGVVIPMGHATGQHLSDPFFMHLLGYLADELSARGQNLLLSRVIPNMPDWLDSILGSGHVDGVIVVGQSDQAATLDRVARTNDRLVVWGAHLPGQSYCSVGTDNRQGGALAAAHLIAQGCRRVAFFGDPSVPEMAQRLEGCRDALARSSPARLCRVLSVPLSSDDAYGEITSYIGSGQEAPDGVFAGSDVIAMTTLRVLAEHGRSVPADVQVVGFDDLPLAAQTVPALTTLRQDIAQGARLLVETLFQRMAGAQVASVQMPAELIVRRSTGHLMQAYRESETPKANPSVSQVATNELFSASLPRK